MIIANPVYDTVFKRLMENRRIAKFFVQTLIGEQVDEIGVIPQEYTYKKIRTKRKKAKDTDEAIKEEVFSIIRFDFVATIRTASGEHKKVLIEIQKSRKAADVVRFRNYIGEQYQRVDMINVKDKTIEKALPIVCIYVFGFTIPKYNTPAVRVKRKSWDMITEKEIKHKSDLIEALTHDGYFVQTPRIKGNPRTVLQKLLSVFEQEYFIDQKTTVKSYEYQIDNENIREMIDILRHTAADPDERRSLEAEWLAMKEEEEYERMLEENERMLEENERMFKENVKMLEEKEKMLKENEKMLEERGKMLEERGKMLEENEKMLEEKGKMLEENAEMKKEIADKDKKLSDMDDKLADMDKKLVDMNAIIADLQRQLQQPQKTGARTKKGTN